MMLFEQFENPTVQSPGRGGIILALGIVAFLLLGPLLGIPTWIMGHRNLKRIKRGEMEAKDRSLTQVGMILGIVGTFVSPVFLIVASIVTAIVITSINAQSALETKNAMKNEAYNIARIAHEYRKQSTETAGGGGLYEGFTLSDDLKHTKHGAYDVQILTPDNLRIIGSSTENVHDGLIADVDENGNIRRWEFSGNFEPIIPFRHRNDPPKQEPLQHEKKRTI